MTEGPTATGFRVLSSWCVRNGGRSVRAEHLGHGQRPLGWVAVTEPPASERMVDGPEPLASCPFPSLRGIVSSRARPSEEPPPGPPPGPHQLRAAGPCTGYGKGQMWRSRGASGPLLTHRLKAINCTDRGDLKCQGSGGASDKPEGDGLGPSQMSGRAPSVTPSLGQAGRRVPSCCPCPCPRGAPSALSQLSKDTHNSENYPPALRDDTVTNRSESNSVSPKLHGQAQLLSRWTLCGEGPARTAGETGGFSLVGGRLAAADQETR